MTNKYKYRLIKQATRSAEEAEHMRFLDDTATKLLTFGTPADLSYMKAEQLWQARQQHLMQFRETIYQALKSGRATANKK